MLVGFETRRGSFRVDLPVVLSISSAGSVSSTA
jgi:hypothetical protein